VRIELTASTFLNIYYTMYQCGALTCRATEA